MSIELKAVVHAQNSISGNVHTDQILKGSLVSEEILKGSIYSSVSIIGKIRQRAELSGYLTPSGRIVGSVQAIMVESDSFPIYRESYSVIPNVEPQIVNTKDKLLINNINVDSIPFFRADNPSGGQTVVIGG